MKRAKLTYHGLCLTLLGMLILISVQESRAQQRMQYTQFMLNGFLTNPALAGMEDYMDLKAGYSLQWAGFQGAPRGVYATFHSPVFQQDDIRPKEGFRTLPLRGLISHSQMPGASIKQRRRSTGPGFRHGLGGYFFSESMGPITMTGVNAAYAIHFPIGRKIRWSLGANLGLLNFRVDPTTITLLDPNDLALSDNIENRLLPNFNVGTMLYHENFFLGGAVKQLLRQRISYGNQNSSLNSRLDMHYFLSGGARFFLGNKTELVPALNFRFVNPAPPSVDAMITLGYDDLIFGGLTYRHKDALAITAGVKIAHRLLLSYSYDYTLSQLANVSSGTHGIVLGYHFGQQPEKLIRSYYW